MGGPIMTAKRAFSYSAWQNDGGGEYAVLFDCPALVMAMDCRAKTTLTPAKTCSVGY